MTSRSLWIACSGALLCAASVAQSAAPLRPSPIPRLMQREGHYALLVDDQPFLILGAQVNNSSAWPSMLPKVWPTAERLGVNTLEVPIYWEQFEPQKGHYDPSILHTLLAQARAHHVHLVLLWFGTWKNGSGHYTPAYIKLNEAEVPHVRRRDGDKVDSLSPHSQFALAADCAAFATFMHALKAADPQRTVLMVQVENEPGTWGSVRDFSPRAETLFQGPVPDTLLQALGKNGRSWAEAFGADADETFHAYSIARYINAVAEAGKREYPLPMYVNVALRDPLSHPKAGSYESGGATDNMIPVWKAAAPSIDILAPDIYLTDFARYTRVLELYSRPDNALFVPETANSQEVARYFFAALGKGSLGFSPFGMDTTGYVNAPLGASRIDDEALAPLRLIYSLFSGMSEEIARLNFEGRLQAISEDPAVHEQRLTFGPWQVDVSYGRPQFGNTVQSSGNQPASGGVMVAQLGNDEFLVTGAHARVDFLATGTLHRQFMKVEEGCFDHGVWRASRIWNGDQTDYGLNFTSGVQVLRVKLATF